VGPNSVSTSNDERGKYAFEHLLCTLKNKKMQDYKVCLRMKGIHTQWICSLTYYVAY
jgi:hypothetical protein